MQERLASGEENLSHAGLHGLLQFRLNGFARQQAKGTHTRSAAVETVAASQIAKRSRNLEPEMVQML